MLLSVFACISRVNVQWSVLSGYFVLAVVTVKREVGWGGNYEALDGRWSSLAVR